MSCVSALCAISWQNPHLNFMDLLSWFTFRIQCYLLVVVATPEWPFWWACLVISMGIQWSLGRRAGCFVPQQTMALSTLPPTLITPFSSWNGLSDLSSPFSFRWCKSLWAFLIQNISTFSSSLGESGPCLPSWANFRKLIFLPNLCMCAVTRISFAQLENLFG